MRFLSAFTLSMVLATGATPIAGQVADTETIDRSTFDAGVRPQDDLYRFVNGKWLDTVEIPADKSNYGAFGKLADLSELRVRELIKELAATEHPAGTNEQKVGDYYRAFMDEEAVNSLGSEPLVEDLAAIDAIDSKAAAFKQIATMGVYGMSQPIGMYVSQDSKNSTEYIVHITQYGLTLPDRAYYLEDEEKYVAAREAMAAYVNTLFLLAGLTGDGEEGVGDSVVAFEKQLAEISWDKTELRDVDKSYNKLTLEQLDALAPGLDWETYFTESRIEVPASVIVRTPSYFTSMAELIEETPIDVLKNYLRFKWIDAMAPYLSVPFVDASFELHGKQLSGIDEQKPRWKRAVGAVAGDGGFGALGEVVGKLYVEKFFKAEAKAKMDELVQNLLKSFSISIDDLTWMTDETKVKAREKLSKIRTKIGYPNEWRSYDALTVEPTDLYGNVMRSNLVEHMRNVEKLGQPIDREEWGMTPQRVNAYYNPGKNEIVFPAAILQPPFFDVDAPTPLNYGGIGAVIGHEISHAFDDQGSKYDGDGNLNSWWTEEDRAAFELLTAKLVNQYDAYEPLPGKNVQGALTLGENIADLSGLSIAYKAMKLDLADQPPIEVAGWNEDQLFFVGWSRVWQRKYRDAEMVKRLLTDPHSPSRFRANGPVTNIEAFYQAFDVTEGDQLFKPVAERIRIW